MEDIMLFSRSQLAATSCTHPVIFSCLMLTMWLLHMILHAYERLCVICIVPSNVIHPIILELILILLR